MHISGTQCKALFLLIAFYCCTASLKFFAKMTNEQSPSPTLSFKDFDWLMNHCFESSAEKFEALIEKFYNVINSSVNTSASASAPSSAPGSAPNSAPSSDPSLIIDQVGKFKGDLNAYFTIMKHAMDRNPSLSDDIWVHNIANNQPTELLYENFFKTQTEFGIVSISPTMAQRKHLRFELERANDQRQDGDLPLVIKKEYIKKLEDVELNEGGFISCVTSIKGNANSTQQPFSKHFLEKIKTETEENKTFLLEELANCLYLLLDGISPPPFTSKKAVCRDQSIGHRLVRYFFSKYTLQEISCVIAELEASLQDELISILHQEDRAYLQDSYLRYNPILAGNQLGREYFPFNQTFGNKLLNAHPHPFGYNRQIPADNDTIQADAATDVLQKLIMADDNFRPLTRRQTEEWYPTTLKKNEKEPGEWVSYFNVTFNPDVFLARKGNIIFDYYLPDDMKNELVQR